MSKRKRNFYIRDTEQQIPLPTVDNNDDSNVKKQDLEYLLLKAKEAIDDQEKTEMEKVKSFSKYYFRARARAMQDSYCTHTPQDAHGACKRVLRQLSTMSLPLSSTKATKEVDLKKIQEKQVAWLYKKTAAKALPSPLRLVMLYSNQANYGKVKESVKMLPKSDWEVKRLWFATHQYKQTRFYKEKEEKEEEKE